MDRNLHVLFFFIAILVSSFEGFSQDCNPKPVFRQEQSDSVMASFIQDYNTALKTSDDALFVSKWFISKAEFDSILKEVSIKNSNCITLEESNFDVGTNMRAYKNLLEAGLKTKINDVTLQEYNHNYSCGNLLDIIRVKCQLRYAENRVSDFSFLMIKLSEDMYKVARYYGDARLLK